MHTGAVVESQLIFQNNAISFRTDNSETFFQTPPYYPNKKSESEKLFSSFNKEPKITFKTIELADKIYAFEITSINQNYFTEQDISKSLKDEKESLKRGIWSSVAVTLFLVFCLVKVDPRANQSH